MRHYVWASVIAILPVIAVMNLSMAESSETDLPLYAMRGIAVVPLTDEALGKIEGMAQGTFEVTCNSSPCQLNIGNTVTTLPANTSTLVQVNSTDTGTISQVQMVQAANASQNVSSKTEITTVGNGNQSVITQTSNASHQVVATQPEITNQPIVTQTENRSQVVVTQPANPAQSITIQGNIITLSNHIF